jgi:hypothetical protein
MSMTRRLLALSMACSAFAAVAPAEDKKDAPVSGLYTGNGQAAKLAYATAMKDDFEKDWTVLVLTEKDPSKEKNPRTAAMFNKCGSALILTITAEGKVVGCEVCHESLKKSGFSSVGKIKTTDFKIADGLVSGTATTEGEVTTFGEKWEVKLKFEVKKP